MRRLLIILALTLLCPQVHAAISLVVATNAGAGGATSVTTSSIDTTGATLIIVHVSGLGYTATPQNYVSDNKSNGTPTLGPNRFYYGTSVICYWVGPTVGSGHTFTVTGVSGDNPGISVAAFSGVTTSSPLDASGSNQDGTGVNHIQPGSVTPSVNNELIVAGMSQYPQATSGSTADSGMSATTTPIEEGSGNLQNAFFYKVQTTAATINPTLSYSGSGGNLAATIATFKAAAAAGPGPKHKVTMQALVGPRGAQVAELGPGPRLKGLH